MRTNADRALRILLLERDADMVQAIERVLSRARFVSVITQVNDKEALREALAEASFDVLIADAKVVDNRPDELTAIAALQPETPLILIIDALRTDDEIESLSANATDYVFEDRLSRLGPSVARATREAAERRELLRTEAALKVSEQRLQLALDAAEVTVWEYDLASGEVRFSRQLGPMLGFSAEEISDRIEAWEALTHPEDLPSVKSAMVRHFRGQSPMIDVEYRIRTRDGDWCWLHTVGRVMAHDALGRASLLTGTHRDVTELRNYQAQLEYRASHDVLTGLLNRRALYDGLDRMVTHAKRAGERLAVLYLDLDRFKVVNDSLGHASGDELLICVAHRVKSCVRESDMVARLGGDEFAVVLTNSGQSLSAAAVAHKILRSIEQPVTIRSQEVVTSSSIGVCVYPNDAADAESLLQNADIAMYRAKTKGTRVCFYTEDLNRIANERLTLENALRRGLSRNEFELHYQPRVRAQSHRVTSVEALVRWRRSEQELVMPGRFIALAEETGLIVPLGEWVLKAACAQMRAWRDAGHEAMRVAVNLSARQLRQPDFVETISDVLADCGLEPRHLELEITESVAMHDPEEMRLLLKSLSDLGVHLAIDDFGTGQSSLAYLKRFHLDYLKIDQSFVHGIHKDEKDESIVRSIIALGKNLRLVVIAEGVESEEQRMFLETEECDEMQGFLFGMPRPAAEVVEAFA